MAFDYVASQKDARALIAEFGMAGAIRYKADGLAENTIVAFDEADAHDIDNRGSPNVLGGTSQIAYIPGDIPWAPSIGDTLEYYYGAVKQERRITAVKTLKPTTVPLLYTLTLD